MRSEDITAAGQQEEIQHVLTRESSRNCLLLKHCHWEEVQAGRVSSVCG